MMKSLFKNLMLVSGLVGMVFLSSCDEDVENPNNGGGDTVDIVATAEASSQFSIFVSALEEAGLTSTFQGSGNFTVFAPTNAAFEDAGISESDLSGISNLADILQYHVVSGSAVMSSQISNNDTLSTMYGAFVRANTTNGVTINGASVDSADIVASNGVIHGISEVLIPNTKTYSAFLLYAPTGDETSKTFFSSEDGSLYSFDEIVSTDDPLSDDIDFGYFYGETSGASLHAIGDYTPDAGYDISDRWGSQNDTEFVMSSITGEDFDLITVSEADRISGEFDVASSTNSRATGLEAGDVIAYKTDEGKTDFGGMFGLIKVVEVVDANDDGDALDEGDGIRLEIKIEAAASSN